MPEEKTLAEATLCYLVTDAHISLGIKKKKIGKGKYNGYGGGFEGSEDAQQCVVRECDEEVGVQVFPSSLEKVALVYFHNTKSDGNTFTCKVHVYFATRWQGTPQETEEIANPHWFLKAKLPFARMMPADRFWLPPVLEGKKVIARACYGPFQRELLKLVEVEIVDELA